MNKDRNSENILVKKNKKLKENLYSAFPIDHGYSLPDDFYILEEWIYWMLFPCI